jgi:hypothetical protein
MSFFNPQFYDDSMSDDELTPEQRFAAPDPEEWVPRALAHGRSHTEILDRLLKLDWTPAAANALIDRAAWDLERYAASPESRRELVKEGYRGFVGGCIMVAFGLLVVAGTFLFASAGVGLMIVPLGLIIVGMVIAGRGYAKWRTFGHDDLFSNSTDSPSPD